MTSFNNASAMLTCNCGAKTEKQQTDEGKDEAERLSRYADYITMDSTLPPAEHPESLGFKFWTRLA